MFDLSHIVRPGQTILTFSAHCDDAAIGCGALLRRFVNQVPDARLCGVVYSGAADTVRSQEEREAASALGLRELEILGMPDSYFPNHWHEIKDHMLTLRDRIGGDSIAVVLCPRLDDQHQDHRVVAEDVWRVFRRHLILEYEIFKYEGDVGRPNFYVRLSEAEASAKLDWLMKYYPSRAVHHWWDRRTLEAPMRLRGLECNAALAEAFVVRKMVW